MVARSKPISKFTAGLKLTFQKPKPLWVEESEQLFFVVLAERSADAHVTNDGAGDAW
jgi:hypothetical protein